MTRPILVLLFGMLASTVQAQVPRLPRPDRQLPSLSRRLLEGGAGDSVDLSIALSADAAHPAIPVRVLFRYGPQQWVQARVDPADLVRLLTHPSVRMAGGVYPAREEISTGASDPTLNRINLAQHRYPQLRGAGAGLAVKERQFDTSDIDFAGRVRITGLESPQVTSHAALMATIAAGAGNSSPFALGAAPAARVGGTSFANLFPDADSVLLLHGLMVQNHSYGTVVESFYGNEAAAYDEQAARLPQLLHVFSAGNAGTSAAPSGTYAGLTGWANLTGNFKQAKNVLTVGAQDSAGQVPALSSRGPAHDGRLRPALVAFGEDGSSGAAALVSGTALLLQEAYARSTGALPPSALLRAVLLNSAQDVERPGIDYVSGYGSLQAHKALEAILNDRYRVDALEAGQMRRYELVVPAGLARLKVTLAWTDSAATPNSARALLHDLDARLLLPATGEGWQPWVLSAAPHPDSLILPARRQRDTLNTAEQITIDAPAAGTYQLEVRAGALDARQEFALSWQGDTAGQLGFTYPTGSDPLVAGQAHYLRWQSETSGAASLEYTLDGSTWTPIGRVPDLGVEYFRWPVPDTFGRAQLRLRADDGTTATSGQFVISPQLGLEVGYYCTDSFLLYWKRVPGAAYQLYALEGAELRPLLQTQDTSLVLPVAGARTYYSLAPLAGGQAGLRSNIFNLAAQAGNCYITGFFLQAQAPGSATFTLQLGTVVNIRTVTLERETAGGLQVIQTITNPSDLSLTLADPALGRGENRYRVRITLSDGRTLFSSTETVFATTDSEPVILYPNPSGPGQDLRIVTNESGRYRLRLLDATGKTVYERLLTETVTIIPAARFSKGLYLAWITGTDGQRKVQKIIRL